MAQYCGSAPSSSRILLGDSQVAHFVADGFLVLDPRLPLSIHSTIDHKLQRILKSESNPGNNILAAVPEFMEVLESPVIAGALESILGRGYLIHPHRFVHNIEPAEQTTEGPKVGRGSHSFVGWHQDSFSPLARSRQHYPRNAMLLYYPQDTPAELGPTQVIPGTQYHRGITPADTPFGIQVPGAAGTCILTHFDIVHGGSLNIGSRSRYMAKFVFMRTEEPDRPSWNSGEAAWQSPTDLQSPWRSDVTWSRIWHWLRGDRSLPSYGVAASEFDAHSAISEARTVDERVAALQVVSRAGERAATLIPLLLSALDDADPVRHCAIYALADIGAPAVAPLATRLKHSPGQWNEDAVVPHGSAYALAAIGEDAVSALAELAMDKEDAVRISALFALGEMGSVARPAISVVLESLKSPSHSVVRMALDALGQIGGNVDQLISPIRDLLRMERTFWMEPLRRTWTAQDQVRTNAMIALLRTGCGHEEATRLAALSLGDPCGYVNGLAVEILIRSGDPSGMRHAIDYLYTHRWDDTLLSGVRTY